MTDDGSVDQAALTLAMRDRFHFLADFGFAIGSSSPCAVVWTSGDRSVTIAHDWRDGHIDVTFSRGVAGQRTEVFSLVEALTAVGAAGDWPTHGWQAIKHEVAHRLVDELAALLQVHADSLLPAGATGWAAAAALATERAQANTVEIAARSMRAKADAAWQAKDWSAVIEQYQSAHAAGAELTKSERKRLAYAQAQL